MSTLTKVMAAAALAGVLSASPAQAETQIRYQITGAYSFADTFDVMQPQEGVIARAGRLAGAWRLTEAGGRSGNVHLNAATAVRIVPGEAPTLMGTMELNMSEFENSASGRDALYIAYEGTAFRQNGPSVTEIDVTGRVVGGRGRYQGARGTLTVTSVNGFIANGAAVVTISR